MTIGQDSKEDKLNVVVTPEDPDKVSERFAKQFSNLITRDYEVKENFFDLFTVEWVSSNANVFSNNGEYIKPIEDTPFEIKYVVKCGDYVSKEYTKSLVAAGVSDSEKLAEVENWLKNKILVDLYLTEGVNLPNVYEKYNIPISWESTNPDVISNDGKITHFVFERYVTLICTYELENGSGGVVKAECIVSPLDTSKMSETEILENFVSAIALSSYDGVKFGYSECPELSTTYGGLYFYTNTESEIVEMLIPIGTSNRSQKAMDPQLVVIHDTANYNASALANAKYVQSGYSNTSTGWHYTTGNDGIYQTLPENECGAHANGTQSTKFELVDTGIKATAKMPIVTLQDGFYYINGQNTKLRPYSNSSGTTFTDVNYETTDINKMGVYVEVGENGNWYMGKTYFNDTYDLISNFGGNKNGIGIESCVNATSDYGTTMRHLAILCAYLCVENDLPVSRVYGHHYFSGKGCPNQIMNAGYWEEFKNLIALEKFALDYFSDYTFTWTSLSQNIDSIGRISLSANAGDVVSYKVSVKNESGVEVLNNTFNTTLK
jgi:hypothetical protein